VAIHDGRVYAADYTGWVHCLDADTGRVFWTQDTRSRIWGSPLVANRHVFVGSDRGEVWVLGDASVKKRCRRIRLPGTLYSSPVAANGALFFAVRNRLFAVRRAQSANRHNRMACIHDTTAVAE